jgi:hypothetical protein
MRRAAKSRYPAFPRGENSLPPYSALNRSRPHIVRIEAKFSHFRWKNAENRDAGIVTYIGDKVKFQNGYGAWQRVTYECDFDPTGESVLDIRIQ